MLYALLLYCCFTAALLRSRVASLESGYVVGTVALLLLYCCFTAVKGGKSEEWVCCMYCCFTAALLLLYCGQGRQV
jgi:hypothetical protein